MSTPGENQRQSPFARPGFIAAAVVVVLIVVAGIVIGIASMMGNGDTETEPPLPPEPETTTTAEAPEPSIDESVCGLDGEAQSGTVSTAPDAEWHYQGTTAYPTSATYGPIETNDDGVRYCFQHSPEGAVFAAANAVVQSSDAEVAADWIEYFLSTETPDREKLLVEDGTQPAGSSADMRMNIEGFRVLTYEGDSARIDLAVRAAGSGNTIHASAVYDLVWEDGDWKFLPQDVDNPLRLAEIPDTAGYIAWGE